MAGWSIGPYGEGEWGVGNPNALVDVTGVEATGQVGNATVQAKGSVVVNGTNVQGNVFVDPVGVSAEANSVLAAGEQAVIAIGLEIISCKANVSVTGVEATGEVGDLDSETRYFVFGVQGLGQVGTAQVVGEGSVEVTGIETEALLGTVTQKTINRVPVTGVEALGETGTVEVDGKANVYPIGVVGTGQLGEEEVQGDAIVNVTGVEAEGFLGTVDTTAKAVVNVTGVVGTIFEGETDESGKAFVTVTGVQAVGRVSRPLVWGLIDTSQTPNWLPIAA
jgi:hypothetical protein